MRAIAPGKLILSGEHAVVYGRPALAMAIDRCAESVLRAAPSPEDLISFDLVDLQATDRFTLRALRDLKGRLSRNYQLFLSGDLSIRDVMLKPIELFEYAYITVLDGLHLKAEGMSIQTRSNIPIGCGLGSSAASVLSVLRGMGHYFRVEFRPDWYLKYSLEVERLQHGHPSGVDSYISLHGGCALFQQGNAVPVPLPRGTMYLVNTGTPAATTGECVVQVRKQFEADLIWNDFETITLSIADAIRSNNVEAIRAAIRENHRLLVRIGVVPARVSQFIADLEAQGGSAKICGAGSVTGDAAGIVLAHADQPPRELCKQYGYTLIPVRGDPLGARIV
jgi:mevalonate kinase